jgi:bifunctional DNase/RNase
MPAVTRHRSVDMRIADLIKVPSPPDCAIVLLEERGGDPRRLLIWIGGPEATSMALRLAGMGRPARPLGADLSVALVDSLGEGTFYATVVVDGPRGTVEVDARPSDALNLALAVGAPVRVDEGVLEQAAAEADQVAVEIPPLPAPGTEGAPGARAIVAELAAG